jgi:hypothetical protein
MYGGVLPVAYILPWLGEAIMFFFFNIYEKECLLQLHERVKERTKQRISFSIVLPSTTPLTHRTLALAQTSHDTCRDQDTDKRNEMYLDERVDFRVLLC